MYKNDIIESSSSIGKKICTNHHLDLDIDSHQQQKCWIKILQKSNERTSERILRPVAELELFEGTICLSRRPLSVAGLTYTIEDGAEGPWSPNALKLVQWVSSSLMLSNARLFY